MPKFEPHAPGYLEERVLRVLSETGPISAREYRELMGIGSATADRHMKELHRRGVLHVFARRRNSHSQTPVYYPGRLPDAKYHPKLTTKEKRANYYYRMKAERPEEWAAKVKRSNQQLVERIKSDPELLARRRKTNADWAARKRAELRGGPAPSKCPIPRPKAYRNIFDDMKDAA